jgi:primosomal protein N' (replication factor Y) (superfamily II helicase)
MTAAAPRFVTVRPLAGVDRALDYKAPPALGAALAVGCLVRVPLGRRAELGIVTALDGVPELPPARLKFVHALEQPFPVMTPDLLRLAEWMERYYAADLASVFEVMIPGAVRKGMQLQQRKGLAIARPATPEELAALHQRAPQQAKLYLFVAGQRHLEVLPRAKILSRLKIPTTSAEALVKKGLLREVMLSERREAYDDELATSEQVDARPFALTDEQAIAAGEIITALEKESFARFLLHGITGSGKTEVYLAAIRETLRAGGSAIFLVPEVALTPQTVGRLRARLEKESGNRAVVWHSHLSDGERYDAWHALATGEARLVVGARSAIFAPLPNLRLIIVDEEHEPAYKQEETPRYHGRDVAVYRAHLNHAVCVLGSATPSLESLHNAQQGKYALLRLTKRIDHRQLPLVHVVDMKREWAKERRMTVFSAFLIEKMRGRYENGEQTILFLNRRGYDASLRCPECGYVAECDHCDLSLTHHRAEHLLRCHLCGFEADVPRLCPKCQSPKIQYRGSGTQKIEDVAAKFLPQARIVRIDTDTMQKKNLFREVLGEFRRGRIDVLVGTQMIAKGLDFPNVTLVGLIDADLSLHLPDFRAFQLLVQVAGRAGRGDRAGEVVVQTALPHHEAIQFARQQDFDGFAEAELAQRREFHYPPFRHLLHHLIRGRSREKVAFYAQQWAKHLDEVLLPDFPAVEIRGPSPCPIERVKDHYRFQLWYFTPSVTALVPRLQELRAAFKWDKDLIEVLDVDAVGLI